MKNNNKQNVRKFHKNGISLIILVITIAVMLILSSAIISSMTFSNENANLSTLVNDVSQLQESARALYIMENKLPITDDAAMSKSDVLNLLEENNRKAFEEELVLNKESENVKFYKMDLEKVGAGDVSKGIGINENDDVFIISENTLRVYYLKGIEYDGNIYFSLSSRLAKIVTLADMSVDESSLGIKEVVPITASVVASAPTEYYGKKVNYKIENESIDSQVNWQIFYADTINIYLIATDYVHYDLLPTKTVKNNDNTETVYTLNKNSNYKVDFKSMISAYNGSKDITDERLQALNSSYYEYLKKQNVTSENLNMKAVAYMLDTQIWNKFKGSKAEYAIGGPTVEMLMKSYNQKCNVDHRAKATSKSGYKVSIDGGENWANSYSKLYNVSPYKIASDSKASAMWLASPSASGGNYMLALDLSGYLYGNGYNYNYIGFRPIVCLNSNVALKVAEGAYDIE